MISFPPAVNIWDTRIGDNPTKFNPATLIREGTIQFVRTYQQEPTTPAIADLLLVPLSFG